MKLSKLVSVVKELVIWVLLESSQEAARLTAAALTDSTNKDACTAPVCSLRSRESCISAGAANLSPALTPVS